MNKLNKIILAMILGLSLSFATVADVITLDISGAASWDLEGDSDNDVLLIDLGGGGPATLDGIGWDLTITTVGGSWLSEAVIGFGSTASPNEINLTAGAGDNFPGVDTYSSGGIITFADIPIPDIILADGVLRIEFFESFDDVADAIDSTYEGTLTLSGTGFASPPTVAEPSTLVLLGLGLIGLGAIRRRMS